MESVYTVYTFQDKAFFFSFFLSKVWSFWVDIIWHRSLCCLLPEATESTQSSFVHGLPPPQCLVDIPDSVSSLCLRLLSGQLGLEQHDPHSPVQLLPTLCMCCMFAVCECTNAYQMHTRLRSEWCHIQKISPEKQDWEKETVSVTREYSPTSHICEVCLFLWNSQCSLNVEQH